MRKQIRPIFCVIWLLNFAMAASAKPDLTTPQATVQSFISALNRYDLAEAAQCIQTSGPSNAQGLAELAKSMKDDKANFTATDLRVVTQGNHATVKFSLAFTPPPSSASGGPESLNLLRQNSDWKIVPLSMTQIGPFPSFAAIFPLLVVFLSDPDLVLGDSQSSPTTICLIHMKQLGVGCLEYILDYDETLAFHGSGLQNDLLPYIKSKALFHCPLDKSGQESYSFNTNLKNIPEALISSPAQTVMIYEGHYGKLEFRHEGKTVIGFVDGRVKLIDPIQAKSLIWKP